MLISKGLKLLANRQLKLQSTCIPINTFCIDLWEAKSYTWNFLANLAKYDDNKKKSTSRNV